MKLRFISACFLLLPTAIFAQISDVADELGTIDDVEAEAWEQNIDVLTDLHEHPINLNTATREQLEQLPFLTAEQVEALSEHVYRYGPMRSEGELAMIEAIDYPTRQRLMQFAYFGEEGGEGRQKLADVLSRGRHELLATARLPLYEREGDKQGYLGYPYRHSLRYTLNCSSRLRAGFVGAQNAGEPFFAGRNSLGYDHYSFYVQTQQLGRLKNVVVGRYRLRLGLGLLVNNDFSLGKLVTLSTVGRSYTTIRGHTSRLEWNYLQGAAATVSLSSTIDITPFFSYRDRDATLGADGQTIHTLLTTGYHRTPSEMERKNNVAELVAGSRLTWRHGRLHAGATAVYNRFSLPLQPLSAPEEPVSPSQRYRSIYPEGRDFWNASFDYGYNSHLLTLNGETATGSSGGVATLNTLSLQPVSQLRLMAVQRFYSYRYYALHSESFSEGGRVQNESGVLVGASWHPTRSLSLTAYADYAYFPWPRYRVSQRSHAWDYLASLAWQRASTKVYARYRLRLRQRDAATDDARSLQNITEQRLRAYVSFSPVQRLSLKTQADLSHVHQSPASAGCMLSETATLVLPFRIRQSGESKSALTLNALAAWFHTDDYDSRLYLYERTLLYQMSFPMLYGHGLRYALFAQAQLSRSLMLAARFSTTNYFDRPTIGTGLQLISSSHQSDIDVQLRWRL